AVAVLVGRGEAVLRRREHLTVARPVALAVAVADGRSALANPHVLRPHRPVVTRPHRAGHAQAVGALLVRLAVAVVVAGRVARLGERRDLADAEAPLAVVKALLRTALADADVLRP